MSHGSTDTPPPSSGTSPVSSADTAASQPAAGDPPRWGPIAVILFVALVVCSNVAGVMYAQLLDGRAGWLLALSSRNRYLVAVLGTDLPIATYFIVASARLAAAFIVCYAIGRAYGDVAVGWFFRFLGTSHKSVDQFNEIFRKAEWFLIPFFIGSNIVAVLAGLHRTPRHKLVPLFVVGVVGRLLLFWWMSIVFERQLKAIVDFITSNQRWFIIVSFVMVAATIALNLRRGADET